MCTSQVDVNVHQPLFTLTLLLVLFWHLRYFETKNEYFIGWLWGNRGDCFLLEFCSVTAANGILCGVVEIGRISSSRSPGKQGPIYGGIKAWGWGGGVVGGHRGRCSHTGERRRVYKWSERVSKGVQKGNRREVK